MKSPLQTAGVYNLPLTIECSKLMVYKTDYYVVVVWYRTTTQGDPGGNKAGASTPLLITNLDGTTCSVNFVTTYSAGSNAIEEYTLPISCKSVAISGVTFGGKFGDFTPAGV